MDRSQGVTRRDVLKMAAVAGAALAGLPGAARGAEKGSGWQIGCYTRPWGKYDYRVALDQIAEAGFKYAGLMTTKTTKKDGLVLSFKSTPEEAEEIGKECRDRGLAVPSVYGGGFPVNEGQDAADAGMRRLVDNCIAAGVKNLLMGGTGEEHYDTYYKAVAANCEYAEKNGVGISVKPHGGKNANGAETRKAIDFVGHKNFGVWYDPGNIFYYSDGKLNPVDDAPTVDGLVVGMAVKDYRDPKIVDITPGTGIVDFPKVMSLLKKGGFTSGALVIECLTPGELPHLLAEAKRAREFVEQLVAEA